MKIVEIRPRRKFLSGIVFDCELEPKEFGAESDAAGYIAIDSELCDMKHLKAGQELSDEEITQLVRESHIKRAKSRASWHLSRGSCSKKALIEKLCRSFPEYAAVTAAERMEELGFIDDLAFAKRRLERLISEKHLSLKAASKQLHFEGVDSEIIDQIVEETEYDAVEGAVELIEKKYKFKLQDKASVDRVIAALMRKGYTFSDIKKALERFNAAGEISEDY